MEHDARQKRLILRGAEKALTDPSVQESLTGEGVTLGHAEELSGTEFLAFLEHGGDDQTALRSVTVVVHLTDSPGAERYAYEDELSEFLETMNLGEWEGGGEGDLGEGAFFDITYSVTDVEVVVPILLERLRRLGAGPRTRVLAHDGREFGLESERKS